MKELGWTWAIRAALAAMLGAAAALGACSKETNVTAGGAATGGAAGAGGSSQPELPDCRDAGASPGTAGAAMVAVGRLDGTCHFMDVTEVTQGDYAAFLASPGRPASQDVPCAWNEALEPSAACLGGASVTQDPAHPAVCVDWCDAAAFCEWAGKALCAGAYAKPADAWASTWYSACSQGGESAYPYGATYDEELCNGADRAVGTSVPVEQGISCVTSTGVRGMSGNVQEWTDECDDATGQGDSCRAYGGSFKKQAAALTCGASFTPERGTAQEDLGFRCCAAPG